MNYIIPKGRCMASKTKEQQIQEQDSELKNRQTTIDSQATAIKDLQTQLSVLSFDGATCRLN
jgi:hypothetical protein